MHPGRGLQAIVFAIVFLAMPAQQLVAQAAKAASRPIPLLPEAPAANDTAFKEDWTSISLGGSGVLTQATGAVELSRVEMEPGCTRQLLRVQWRPLDPIDLYVIRPHGDHKLPVVLFLYNYTYDSDIFREDRWCQRAKENGFAVVGFASALSRERTHTPRPPREWFVSEMQEALATSTHDVQMVLNYLETRGDLKTERVAVLGQGSGGAVAVLAAAADPRIGVLDLMDPWGDWPDWLKSSSQIPEDERAAYLQPRFLRSVAELDPVLYLPRLKDRSLYVQQVLDNAITPPLAAEKIADSVPMPATVNRFPNITSEAEGLGRNGILHWLGEQLALDHH